MTALAAVVDQPAAGGMPTWLVVVAAVLTLLGSGGVSGIVVAVLNRRRRSADVAEVYSKVAVTLIEPLERRLAGAEQAVDAEQERYRAYRRQAEVDLHELRLRVREALGEADQAARQAHRLRLLVQQWHRAIMDPTATIDWLRELVGPTEPTL